jgi:hypothetical protein
MPKRQSISPTYDSRKTGPRYHVTTRVGDRTIAFEERTSNPFVRQTVTLGWRDLLRGLLHRSLEVTVLIGADPDVVEDVLDLDANNLGYDCTRRDNFNLGLQAAMEGLTAQD